jgi:uncharacterized ParB-like nuclease family protein
MSDVAPSTAVVAAGNVPAFVVADLDLAEMLAPLAPFTTPARFQSLVLDVASCPDAMASLRRRHACLRALFQPPVDAWRHAFAQMGNDPP